MAGVSYSVDSDFYVGVRMGQPGPLLLLFLRWTRSHH
jgi:hypothetical protein